MFVILTSKPGQFRTELVNGLEHVEAFDYMFYGRCKAHFVIASLQEAVKVKVIDETPPEVVNFIPSKFLEKFETLEQARGVLQALVQKGDADVTLIQR